jgi:hypothetical protein
MLDTGGRKTAILVTGADERFADFMFDALDSLLACGVLDQVQIGVLDFGLSTSRLRDLDRFAPEIVKPRWPHFVPRGLQDRQQLGLISRPFLRDLFPGYQVYVWFDADAWAQDPSFLQRYVHGAQQRGAAVALENGWGYRKSSREKTWWFGNLIRTFGPTRGIQLCLRTSLNIGILALSSAAPHWDAWSRRYAESIDRTGKLTLDQHAFYAAVHLDKIDTSFLAASDNWQPILSVPAWDEAELCLCEPGPYPTKISIIHLAGPDKERLYQLGGRRSRATTLRYRGLLGAPPRISAEHSKRWNLETDRGTKNFAR